MTNAQAKGGEPNAVKRAATKLHTAATADAIGAINDGAFDWLDIAVSLLNAGCLTQGIMRRELARGLNASPC